MLRQPERLKPSSNKTASTLCDSEAFPLTIRTGSAAPLPTVPTRHRYDGRVPAILSVGVALLHYVLNKVVLPRLLRSACHRPPEFGDFKHRRDGKAVFTNCVKQPTFHERTGRMSS